MLRRGAGGKPSTLHFAVFAVDCAGRLAQSQARNGQHTGEPTRPPQRVRQYGSEALIRNKRLSSEALIRQTRMHENTQV
eukprot:1483209-Pyramimonas_sp.AAC.1